MITKPIQEVVEIRRVGAPRMADTGTGNFVEKFFLFGALSALFAGVGIGVYLWLGLNGQLPLAPSFLKLRIAHSQVQFYLFFGVFILGFLLQTAPKLLQSKLRPTRAMFGVLPTLYFGVLSGIAFPSALWPRLLLAANFAVVFWLMVLLVRASVWTERWRYSSWVLVSLAAFSASPFISLANGGHSISAFWWCIVPVVFSSAQQFLAAFLDGHRLSARGHFVTFVFFVAAGGVLLSAEIYAEPWLYRIAGVLSVGAIASFLLGTNAVRSIRRAYREPLALGFSAAFIWALLGAIALAMKGGTVLDSVIHAWSLGWISTLVIAISSHLLRVLAGHFPLSPGLMWLIVFIWQFVPFGRSGRGIFVLPPAFSLAVAAAVFLTFVPWALGVVITGCQMWRAEILQSRIRDSFS